MTMLLLILALLGGYAFGIWSTFYTIKKYYRGTWLALVLETKLNKQKRADVARQKEVSE